MELCLISGLPAINILNLSVSPSNPQIMKLMSNMECLFTWSSLSKGLEHAALQYLNSGCKMRSARNEELPVPVQWVLSMHWELSGLHPKVVFHQQKGDQFLSIYPPTADPPTPLFLSFPCPPEREFQGIWWVAVGARNCHSFAGVQTSTEKYL